MKRELSVGEQFLIDWQYNIGSLGSFKYNLTKTIVCADDENLERLSKGFPEEVEAIKRFRTESGYWSSVQRIAGYK